MSNPVADQFMVIMLMNWSADELAYMHHYVMGVEHNEGEHERSEYD